MLALSISPQEISDPLQFSADLAGSTILNNLGTTWGPLGGSLASSVLRRSSPILGRPHWVTRHHQLQIGLYLSNRLHRVLDFHLLEKIVPLDFDTNCNLGGSPLRQ